ncbi:MAG: amino acid ABC transporter permease [Desulfuromusa sp.]|nr:amino acid ABC transporter permease [Desulfuromusa sp.]
MGNQSISKPELLEFIPKPSRLPAVPVDGFIGRLKKHLFSNIWNTLLTVSVFTLLFMLIKPFLDWAIFDAVWSASNRRECLNASPDGACWPGVIQWFNGLIYGRYPNDQQWRINLGFGLGILWLVPLAFKRVEQKILIALSAITLFPFLANFLFLGGSDNQFNYIVACVGLAYLLILYINIGLIYLDRKILGEYLEPLIGRFYQRRAALLGRLLCWLTVTVLLAFLFQNLTLLLVEVDSWGGLFLTLIISGFSIVMALPIGILLALGRRSHMPVFRWLSICTIELVRSVPLITVLFMSVTMLPLFFPNTMELNKLVQVLVAVCVFAGAYMAETVRGGLQGIPPGQFEAAKSVGLGYWYTMAFIILPQALRAMIPNIVTSFISLFKDTTLVSIIGLFDIMLMARNISIDKNWLGLHTEPLIAISILFFIFCYSMSQYSHRLEKKLKNK